ncbi:glycosyltransferase [Paenibacillus sp. FSL M8-0142]|uniref:glycosyltransferase n=1 Tax=Paenibacillus sp. FSL M8-0142 TaxID=2954525 RepID=UPI00315AB548
MKTSIIILTFNKLDYTIQCIESIRQFTTPGTYELIVIDNLSTDGTQQWLMDQDDIISILNKENLGFPKGCNQGIEIATGEAILLLNNDTIVTENWLDNLTACLNSDKKIGAVSCVTNNSSYAQSIPTSYNSLEEMHSFSREFNHLDSSKWEERLKLVGFCYLIKKSVIKEVGPLDERFTPGNYEDDDLSVRIRLAGYKLILCKDTFIHHYGSVSFGSNSKSFNHLLAENAKKFEEKWGFNPDYSQFIRNDIVTVIDSDPMDPIKVLEIGCACGGTLLKIKSIYKNSSLYGIELNKASAQIASLIADVRNDDIESNCLSYPEDYFDYIIFGDVLEHLHDPWGVLERVKKHLKFNGKIIASIPNVMHHSVIDSLLRGSWDYTKSGILDQTHIRFFTLDGIRKMMFQAGYYRLNIFAKSVTKLSEDSLIHKIAPFLDENVLVQFNAYQYIVSASKHNLDEVFASLVEQTLEAVSIVQKLEPYSYDEIIKAVVFGKEKITDKVELLNLIGIANFELGKYDRVLPYFEQSYYLNQEDADTLYNLSYFLQVIGENEQSKVFMSRLNEISPIIYEELRSVLSTKNDETNTISVQKRD